MKLFTSIASTTHIDRHNERMAKSALDGMATQIKERYIPQLIEHDWNRHIGVVLYGEVFQLSDGEYALGIVSGTFESEEEKSKFVAGEPNSAWKDYKRYLDVKALLRLVEKDKTEYSKPPANKSSYDIASLLETHLDSTQVLPNGAVYKIKRFIAATRDLKIEVYPKDHHPEHFHIVSKQRNIDARFDINTLEFISNKKGKIGAKDIRRIQDFFESHPNVLNKLKSEFIRLN